MVALPYPPRRLTTAGHLVAMDGGMLPATTVETDAYASGAGHFAVAERRRFIETAGRIRHDERELLVCDRDGGVDATLAPRRQIAAPRRPPADQRRVVVMPPSAAGGGGLRVWNYIPRRTPLPPSTHHDGRWWWGWSSPGTPKVALMPLSARPASSS